MNIRKVVPALTAALGAFCLVGVLYLGVVSLGASAPTANISLAAIPKQALSQPAIAVPFSQALQPNPNDDRAPWDVTPVPEEVTVAASSPGDGKPPLSAGTVLKPEEYLQLIKPSSPPKEQPAPGLGENGPTITIWYGDVQRFGHLGKPQEWANILGNISGPNPIITLTCTLNGGAPQPLALGPDERRLGRQGDFNIEIAYSALVVGDNTVVITGIDSLGAQAVHTVTVTYTGGVNWPTSSQVTWNAAGTIQDSAQVVDGKWTLEGSTVRPVELAYDRMIAIGDITWSDYEVVVPVTIHSIDEEGFASPSNGPGVGLLLRWQGHFNEAGEQPNIGWKNLGALAWFRWKKDINDEALSGLQMIGFGGGEITVNPNKQASPGVTYLMKMSVQSLAAGPYYRFKVWNSNEPEPLTWDMQASGRKDGLATGSLLLVAHHVDASFGQVTVQPLNTILPKLQVSNDGNGTVTVSPQKSQYAYGETVTLTAIGNSGYRLASWSGDATGAVTPLVFDITQDTVITANFVAASVSPKITIAKPANGRIVVSPERTEYLYGETVSFTAIPDPGYMLSAWAGDLAGHTNPLFLTINSDISATANFVAAQAPLSDDFNRCTLDTNRWTYRDPVGDVTFSTPGKRLFISIPSGTNHDLWTGRNFAPRFLQAVENVDFAVEAKFESPLTARYQAQGIIIEQDNDNFLRFELYYDGTDLHVYAASIISGTGSARVNQIVIAGGAEMYLRVERVGNRWTESYSFDGINWTVGGAFTQTFTATAAGIHAVNAGLLPAHTAIVDYFFNTAAPIVPEDPREFSLLTNTVGQGQITVSPAQTIYTCGDQITLTANPADGWSFAGWSGSLTGAANPAVLSFDMGAVVTATFTQGEQTPTPTPDSTLYLPLITKDQ